jgi:hypothetical protein
MKTCALILLLALSPTPTNDGWQLFARTKFVSTYMKPYNEYFLVPQFDTKLKQLQGTEIELKGHYIPMDLLTNSIVLSKNPYSSCFFCGGAGPETVAEINFKSKRPKLKPDQIITVRGKLRLNDKDVEHMTFILDQAEIIN